MPHYQRNSTLPRTSNGAAAWFTPEHNAWIEKNCKLPAGTIQHLYQSDELLVEVARRVLQRKLARPQDGEKFWIDGNGRRLLEVAEPPPESMSERRKLRWRVAKINRQVPEEMKGKMGGSPRHSWDESFPFGSAEMAKESLEETRWMSRQKRRREEEQSVFQKSSWRPVARESEEEQARPSTSPLVGRTERLRPRTGRSQ